MKLTIKSLALMSALTLIAHAHSMHISDSKLAILGKKVYATLSEHKGLIGLTAGAVAAGYYLYHQYTQQPETASRRDESDALAHAGVNERTIDECEYAGVGLDISKHSSTMSGNSSSLYQSALGTPDEDKQHHTLDVAALQERLETVITDSRVRFTLPDGSIRENDALISSFNLKNLFTGPRGHVLKVVKSAERIPIFVLEHSGAQVPLQNPHKAQYDNFIYNIVKATEKNSYNLMIQSKDKKIIATLKDIEKRI
jgi:hypothetical protein